MRARTFTHAAWLIAPCLWACSTSSEPKGREAPPKSAVDAAQPAASKPALIREPKFAARVTGNALPSAPAPAAAPSLRWNLDAGRAYAYDIKVEGAQRADGRQQQLAWGGTLVVEGQGSDQARFMLRDVTGAAAGRTPAGVADKGLGQGLLNGARDAAEILAAWLPHENLILPDRALAVGESATIPIFLTTNFGEGPVRLDGQVVIKLTGYVQAGGKTLARLESTLSLAREGTSGGKEWIVGRAGKGVILFDPAAQSVHSAEAASSSQFYFATRGETAEDAFVSFTRNPANDPPPGR